VALGGSEGGGVRAWWLNDEKFSVLAEAGVGQAAGGAVFGLAVHDRVVYAACEDGLIRRHDTDRLREPSPDAHPAELCGVSLHGVVADGPPGVARPGSSVDFSAIPAGVTVQYCFMALGPDKEPYALPEGSATPFSAEMHLEGVRLRTGGVGGMKLKRELFQGCAVAASECLHQVTGSYVLRAVAKGGDCLMEKTVTVVPGPLSGCTSTVDLGGVACWGLAEVVCFEVLGEDICGNPTQWEKHDRLEAALTCDGEEVPVRITPGAGEGVLACECRLDRAGSYDLSIRIGQVELREGKASFLIEPGPLESLSLSLPPPGSGPLHGLTAGIQAEVCLVGCSDRLGNRVALSSSDLVEIYPPARGLAVHLGNEEGVPPRVEFVPAASPELTIRVRRRDGDEYTTVHESTHSVAVEKKKAGPKKKAAAGGPKAAKLPKAKAPAPRNMAASAKKSAG